MSENKDIEADNKKRKTYKILLFLFIIMTSIGIFLASYYMSVNKVYGSYETTLYHNISGINDVNKNMAQFFYSNQTIDVEYAKIQLPNAINDLSKLRNGLVNSQPTSKYKNDYENLLFGLDNNISIYRQSLAILKDPSGADVEVYSNKLKSYRNDCMNFYSLIDIHNVKIELPETSLSFIDNVLNDSSMALSLKKEADIKYEQNQEFINKVDAISKDYLNIKINYYSNVTKIRKKDITYDELLSQVDDNLIKLSVIQANFENLSMPPSTVPTYDAFKPLLEMYEEYLRDFKLSLISEKIQALNEIIVPSESNSLYTSSNLKFNEIVRFYSEFIKIFTDLKNK